MNVITNHDFSSGLDSWHPNCCKASVVSPKSDLMQRMSKKLGSSQRHARITSRKETWQGLEQDITARVSAGSTYKLAAHVGISSAVDKGVDDVYATLRLEYHGSDPQYVFIARKSVSENGWEVLEGAFSLSSMPQKVVFYIEGPSPGVDLLIKLVVISCSSSTIGDNQNLEGPSDIGKNLRILGSSSTKNVINNHDFSSGLDSWHPNCCKASVVSPKSNGTHARITSRMETWQGLEQDITTRVSTGSTYMVAAHVSISGAVDDDVNAMLRLEYRDSDPRYVFIARKSVSEKGWEVLEGTFSLSIMPHKVVFYIEGPSPGVDLLIKSVIISTVGDNQSESSNLYEEENVLSNSKFDDGLKNWSDNGCKISLHESMGNGNIVPQSGKFFACATKRTASWNGIQQDITGKVNRKLVYEVDAVVRVFGNNGTPASIEATLLIESANQNPQYVGVAKVPATEKDWIHMQGKFLINGFPSKVVLYLEGPPPGVDILLNSMLVKHAAKVPPSPRPATQDVAFGENIIKNSNFTGGTAGWFAHHECKLSVGNGSPSTLPVVVIDSLGAHQPLSGSYILVKNRTYTWMGPAQMITDKVIPYLTYQVGTWVRLGRGASSPQKVNVTIKVDNNEWVNGGQVEINDEEWHEIGGAFRIEKQPREVEVYVSGPDPGIDLMVAGLHIFPVDRQARFRFLREKTDEIRKCDVVLKLSGSKSGSLHGTSVRVKQTQNSFPFGSCLMRTNIDNEDFTKFFVENFNWAVFGNELKWNWTEEKQGQFNYKDADELLKFCTSNDIKVRGHCIFWEVESEIHHWVRNLTGNHLMKAVENRLRGLLTRYKGKFHHYDVNNEMLHGSFFQDRLGNDILAKMFKNAKEIDPSATLFVNDYHVEDGCDTDSSPEKYIEHICELQEQGAPIGGIAIQGHIDSPVGSIVCSALDKLAILGLPIWFTELEVSSKNEYVRADDLEVMLREVYAHPAVEGVILWGFWELYMSRENSHLINAEGDLNEAGRRYLVLKDEWLTWAHGQVDGHGEFCFRGFPGSYELEIGDGNTKFTQNFVVEKGKAEKPLIISINIY